MPEEAFKMFDEFSNFELRRLARDLVDTIPENLRTEIWAQERKGHESHGTQFRFLNRLDLLYIIYGYLKEEIKRIDETPLDQVPLLINEKWSCPLLKERVLRRLKIAK